jgi:hypothetical protein
MHRARGALRVLKAISKPAEAAAEQPSLLQLLHRRYSILSNSFRGEAGEVSRDAGRQVSLLYQLGLIHAPCSCCMACHTVCPVGPTPHFTTCMVLNSPPAAHAPGAG